MAADLQGIAERLTRDDLTATVEYPGFIQIPIADGRCWCFGIANPVWGGDLMNEDGSQVVDTVECGIASTSDDVEGIALAILAALSQWDEQRVR